MEVSQIAGLDTHAIIGGGKAHAFTMSESAEFFTVLSDTLYRDKKLAMCREVICNAWDAHIILGKRDVPIEIRITDTELIIQDFGPGIPSNKVGTIYCRYGASTKVKDENQTGGFGLGSKAPFAYSDHFSVTDCVDGFKHVYAISRGGAETDGKPDFREMVKVPTTETGVTVSIPLKTPADKDVLLKIARSVVRRGGMKAKINDTLVVGYDYSKATQGFALIADTDYDMRESHVYCLYGTVLYPVTTTDTEISEAVGKLADITHQVGKLILIAPPNSVGVTPSRESLSYTDRTRETLVELLARAERMISTGMKPVAKELMFKAAANVTKKEKTLPWNRQIVSNDFRGVIPASDKDGSAMDLDSIVRKCATFHIQRLVKNEFKTTRLAFAAVNKDFRRIFRRAAYTPAIRERYNTPKMPRINGFRIEARTFQRIANKLSLHTNLYAFVQDGNHNSGTVRPLRIDKTIPDRATVAKKLYISFNQRDAIGKIATDRNGAYISYDMCHADMVFVLKRGQHAMIDKIKGLAKKYGIETIEVKITPPPKRAPKVVKELLFHSLQDIVDGEKSKAESLPVGVKHYVRGGSDHYERRHCFPFVQCKKELKALFGDIAVAFDAKEEAKLKAKGAEPLVDTMVEFLKERADKKDVQYAYWAAKGFIENAGYQEPSYLIKHLSMQTLEMAAHFFPPKMKVSDDAKKAYVITRVLQHVLIGMGERKSQRETRDWMKAQLDALQRNGAKTFKHLFVTRKEANEKWKSIKSIVGVSYYLDADDEEQIEDLFAVMRFMERRHQARVKVRSSEDTAKVAETAPVVTPTAELPKISTCTALMVIPEVVPTMPAVNLKEAA